MSKLLEKAMELTDSFVMKSMDGTLQEFEQLAYEALCNMTATWAKCVDADMRADLPDMERKALKAQEEEPSVKEDDEDDDRNAVGAT